MASKGQKVLKWPLYYRDESEKQTIAYIIRSLVYIQGNFTTNNTIKWSTHSLTYLSS